ncbi:MAG TPA: hypothetical protein VF848_08915 [Steroidobacteraceae bacterium]
MLRQILAVLTASACIVMAGCATIVHGGARPVSVASTPPGAKVSIYDRDNKLVLTSTTPFVAQLNPKYAYFKGQNYRLVFEMPAHATAEVWLDSTVSGWYWWNFLFGGLIGMVIVDPLTGAMFNLTPDKIEQPLTASQTEVIRDRKGLLVVMASQLTEHERAAMVRIN